MSVSKEMKNTFSFLTMIFYIYLQTYLVKREHIHIFLRALVRKNSRGVFFIVV